MKKPYTVKDFNRAALQNVNEGLDYGRWVTYEHFQLHQTGDAYVHAPLWPSKKLEEYRHTYNPLRARGLFLEFAELADGKSGVTQADFLKWTRRWGVLGTGWRERGRSEKLYRGGPWETFSRFKEEAELSCWVLRLYEAVTAEDGPDIPEIRTLLELSEDGSPEEFAGWAISEVAWVIQQKLTDECFPRIYRRGGFDLVHNTSGFGSLLGAMYLQMMWLTTAEVNRCDGPECNKIIYFDPSELPDDPKQRGEAVRGRYKSKRFCSENCRVKAWQRKKREAGNARSGRSTNRNS